MGDKDTDEGRLQANHPDRAKHLKQYRWKPGESGNPKGRPKVKTSQERLRDAMLQEIPLADGGKITTEDAMDRICIRMLLEPDRKKKLKPMEWCTLWRELLDRYGGKPFQSKQDADGDGDAVIAEFNDQLRRMCESMGMPPEEKPDTAGRRVVL